MGLILSLMCIAHFKQSQGKILNAKSNSRVKDHIQKVFTDGKELKVTKHLVTDT